MKIIKNNMLKESEKISVFPVSVVCDNCGSVFEVEDDDVNIGVLGLYVLKKPYCPCCGSDIENTLDFGVDLNIDNLNFPQHYYKFDGKDINDKELIDRINKTVKDLINELKQTNDKSFYNASSSVGSMLINVTRYSFDEEFVVQISNGFYEVNVPFTNGDKEKWCEYK